MEEFDISEIAEIIVLGHIIGIFLTFAPVLLGHGVNAIMSIFKKNA